MNRDGRLSGRHAKTEKTQAIQRTIRPPVITIDGNTMNVLTSINYLGLRIDKKLNFNEYIRDARTKTHELANKLLQMTRRIYGTKGQFIKTVIESVVKPAVLYAKELWGHKAKLESNKKSLNPYGDTEAFSE